MLLVRCSWAWRAGLVSVGSNTGNHMVAKKCSCDLLTVILKKTATSLDVSTLIIILIQGTI